MLRSSAQSLVERHPHRPQQHGSALPSDDDLRTEHADAGFALLVITLRFLHECGGSLTVSAARLLSSAVIGDSFWLHYVQHDQLPMEDFTNLSRELAAMYSLALGENEDHLKIRLDAVGMLLSYLGEEMKVLQEKHSSWLSTGGTSRGRTH